MMHSMSPVVDMRRSIINNSWLRFPIKIRKESATQRSLSVILWSSETSGVVRDIISNYSSEFSVPGHPQTSHAQKCLIGYWLSIMILLTEYPKQKNQPIWIIILNRLNWMICHFEHSISKEGAKYFRMSRFIFKNIFIYSIIDGTLPYSETDDNFR